MPFPQITDVPLTDAERLVTARCIHTMRELWLLNDPAVDEALLDELTVLKARFLGPDLKLPIEASIEGLTA